MIAWIFLIILTYYIITTWERFLPDSFIPYKLPKTYRIIPNGSREFNIGDPELLDEIDEIEIETIDYPFIVEGFVCNVTTLHHGDIIKDPLILFGNNDLTWDSDSYISCNGEIFFPEPGSTIINESPKIYNGKTIRIIIGKYFENKR